MKYLRVLWVGLILTGTAGCVLTFPEKEEFRRPIDLPDPEVSTYCLDP